MIKIDGISLNKEEKTEVKINHYVAINFQTKRNTEGGARYILLKNLNQSIIEFKFPSNSMILKEFSVVLIKKRLHRTLRGSDKILSGIPIFAIPEGDELLDWDNRTPIKFNANFGAFIGSNFIEIIINDYNQFDVCIQCGDVQFLLWNYCLAGIKVLNRSKEDLEIFAQHLKE